MNIRNEWRMFSHNQRVWISLVAAVALSAAAIDCFSLVEPQNWYVVGLGIDTCFNASLLASEVGQPQLASPYKLESWEQKHLEGYMGTTLHLHGGRGVMVAVANHANFMMYFSKKSACLTFVKRMEDN